jgi:hypothetical protein
MHDSFMSKVEQMETELRKLSPNELQQLRDWLEDYLEDQLEVTEEFAASIERGKRDIAEGNVRVRESDSA